MDLALVDMRWTSDMGVRCGRVDVAIFEEGGGDEVGGGVLGGVVEIARILVAVGWWWVLDRRWIGTARCLVVNLRVVDFGIIFLVWEGAGHEKRCG